MLDRFITSIWAERRYLIFLEGIGNTLILSLCAAFLGVCIGLALTYLQLAQFGFIRNRGLRRLVLWVSRAASTLYLDVIRGTPSFIQLLIIYFVVFGSSNLNKLIVGAIAFGINSGAYVAEIVRAGILSVDHGQTEAGHSLGLNQKQTMIYIVIPQAVKNILPTLANEFIVLIKETAVVGYIAVMDITKAATSVYSRTYDAFPPLITSAAIYYVIIKALSTFLRGFEKKLRKADHRG